MDTWHTRGRRYGDNYQIPAISLYDQKPTGTFLLSLYQTAEYDVIKIAPFVHNQRIGLY